MQGAGESRETRRLLDTHRRKLTLDPADDSCSGDESRAALDLCRAVQQMQNLSLDRDTRTRGLVEGKCALEYVGAAIDFHVLVRESVRNKCKQAADAAGTYCSSPEAFHQQIQQPVGLLKMAIIQLGFVQQNLVDPVGGNLLGFPGRRLLKELVDLSVQLVHGVDENRQTAGGALSHNPRHRRFEAKQFDGFVQLSGEKEDRSPFGVFGFLVTSVRLLQECGCALQTYPELGHESTDVAKCLSAHFFVLRTQTDQQFRHSALLN